MNFKLPNVDQRTLFFASLTAACTGIAVFRFWQVQTCIFDGSSDTGWLIQTGQWILQHHSLPKHDIFSWTFPNRSWVVYQWLYDVILAFLFNDCGNLWGIGLVTACVVATICFFILPRQWMRLGLPPALAYAGVAAAAMPYWYYIRPQLVSYIFIMLVMRQCERSRLTGCWKPLLVIPPLMALWANMHLFYIFGLVIGIAYLIDAIASKQRWQPLAVMLAASAACVLMNPHGLNLLLYAFTFFDNTQYMNIWEVRTSLTDPYSTVFLVYLATCTWALIKKRKDIPVAGLILAAVGVVTSLAARRFEAVAILLTWPFFGMALAALLKEHHFQVAGDGAETSEKNNLAPILAFASVLAVAGGIYWLNFPNQKNVYDHFFEGGARTIAQYKQLPKDGVHLFNDPMVGSWLILAGATPVYVDTRFDMYPKNLCVDAYATIGAAPGWQDYLRKHDINAILIHRYCKRLREELAKSDQWNLSLDDGAISYWVRKQKK